MLRQNRLAVYLILFVILMYLVLKHGPKFAIFGTRNEPEAEDKIYKDLEIKISPPPSNKSSLKLANPKNPIWSEAGQSYIVDEILRNRTNGFFLECGAATGEDYSNTLYFEVYRNWTGLLIEANDEYLAPLHSKNRNAYIYEGCLSPFKNVSEFVFSHMALLSGLNRSFEDSRRNLGTGKTTLKKCIPLMYLLRRLNIKHIDYFSLDTEGSELDILSTIPLDKIRIDVLSIEWAIYRGKDSEMAVKRDNLIKFMEKTNLYNHKDVKHKIDLFFYRKDLFKN